jgi:hypothetical protein
MIASDLAVLKAVACAHGRLAVQSAATVRHDAVWRGGAHRGRHGDGRRGLLRREGRAVAGEEAKGERDGVDHRATGLSIVEVVDGRSIGRRDRDWAWVRLGGGTPHSRRGRTRPAATVPRTWRLALGWAPPAVRPSLGPCPLWQPVRLRVLLQRLSSGTRGAAHVQMLRRSFPPPPALGHSSSPHHHRASHQFTHPPTHASTTPSAGSASAPRWSPRGRRPRTTSC